MALFVQAGRIFLSEACRTDAIMCGCAWNKVTGIGI